MKALEVLTQQQQQQQQKKGKQLVNKQPVKEEESTDHEYKFENTDRE